MADTIEDQGTTTASQAITATSTPVRVPLPKSGLFKIVPRGDQKGSSNFTFTWEVTKEARDVLTAQDVRHPFLLIVVSEVHPPNPVSFHGTGCGCGQCCGYLEKIYHELHCLHEGAAQVQLTYSATFRIQFLVIWSRYHDHDKSWSKSRGSLYVDNHVEALDGNHDIPKERLEHVEEIDLCITNSLFAEKPSKFGWWWANYWFEDPPRNECYYKRRLLLISFPQTLFLLLYVPIRAVCAVVGLLFLVLLGYRLRCLHLMPAFRPFETTFSMIRDQVEKNDNYAFYDSEGKERSSALRVILRMPLLWVVLTVAVVAICRIPHHARILTLELMGYFAGSIVMAVLATMGGKRYFASLPPRQQIYYEKTLARLDPTEKRSIPLLVRYLDLKHRVCLPYARKG